MNWSSAHGVGLRRALRQQCPRSAAAARTGSGSVRQRLRPWPASPGTVLGGNGALLDREQRLCPSSRSNRNTIAVLGDLRDRVDACGRSARTVTRLGGDGKSRSQMSWCTAWKCHTRLPGRGVEGEQRSWRTGCRRADRRRRSRTPPIPSATYTTPRASSSAIPGPVVGGAAVLPGVLRPRVVPELARDAESCGTTSAARPCARRRRGCRPATPAATRRRGRRRSTGPCRRRRACVSRTPCRPPDRAPGPRAGRCARPSERRESACPWRRRGRRCSCPRPRRRGASAPPRPVHHAAIGSAAAEYPNRTSRAARPCRP